MKIPFPPDDTTAAYHRMLAATLTENIPYMQTAIPRAEGTRYPAYFPGTGHPGILPVNGIPVVPPMEIFAENVNNPIIKEENCTAPLQSPEKCGILY